MITLSIPKEDWTDEFHNIIKLLYVDRKAVVLFLEDDSEESAETASQILALKEIGLTVFFEDGHYYIINDMHDHFTDSTEGM